eukprot:g14454.t1
MYVLPFASWVVPRDLRNPCESSSKDDRAKNDEKDKKPTIKAKSGQTIGSWIVAHDDKGIPYWTNDVSEESTYRLLVQQTNHPAMPLKHVGDGRQPPWKLPLTAPAPKKASKKEGGKGFKGGDNGPDKQKKKDQQGGGGDNDDGSTRMGIWEELFDAVNGTKIWYNTVTRKKTNKDPFF